MSMTPEELARFDALWPDVETSPWNIYERSPWPRDLTLGGIVSEYDQRVAARARLLALLGRARYTAGGWDVEHVVHVGDAERGIGGFHLCHREPSYWEPFWTRDLTGFEPLDDAAREVLAFVALQIERDHHRLGEHAGTPWSLLSPLRDAHLRYLREFSTRMAPQRDD